MKPYHTLVAGDTGAGKSTYLREMHERARGRAASYWINHNGERGVSDSGSCVNWRTDDVDAALQEIWEEGQTYREKTGYPLQVIVDEAHRVMGNELEESHPLKKMLHEGRSYGVKVVLATQDPSDLQPNYAALKQCRWIVWVGKWARFHEGFLRYFDIPRDRLPDSDFEVVTFDKQMNVVWQGSTKEKYA